MKIEKFAEKLECHECGKTTRVYSIHLQHLCMHYLGLCPKCLGMLKQKLSKTKGGEL